MAKPKSTEVATQNAMGFLATVDENNLPAHLQNDGPARGSENVTSDDLQTPRLRLLQAISDERNKRHESYIEGAEEGYMFDTVDRNLFKDGVYVVSLMYVKRWNVWRTRDAGGGLVASVMTESAAREELAAVCRDEGVDIDNREAVDAKFEVTETPEQICMLIDPETCALSPLIIDMPKTKQKVCKNWNSQAAKKPGDRFSHVWKVGSKVETRGSDDYFNYTVEYAGPATQEIYDECEEEFGHIETMINNQKRAEGLID